MNNNRYFDVPGTTDKNLEIWNLTVFVYVRIPYDPFSLSALKIIGIKFDNNVKKNSVEKKSITNNNKTKQSNKMYHHRITKHKKDNIPKLN